MKENTVRKAEFLFYCVYTRSTSHSSCQLADHHSFADVKYMWINFHWVPHELKKVASLRPGVDERVGSAGEMLLRGREDMLRDVGTSAEALQICDAQYSLV